MEVRGLTEDLEAFDVVLTEAEVYALEGHPRIGIAACDCATHMIRRDGQRGDRAERQISSGSIGPPLI